ncbi:unnamed protein product [Nippostrongylus brasiliensis]|uniref:SCP domain-containing protein n=1 Tax=Nippostrongylus brasiliensis TaxID=27835 RepID=A0A0N4YHC0_NIPBR|nr:unnamed protein product [Nippostrongylus brasiliensis]
MPMLLEEFQIGWDNVTTSSINYRNPTFNSEDIRQFAVIANGNASRVGCAQKFCGDENNLHTASNKNNNDNNNNNADHDYNNNADHDYNNNADHYNNKKAYNNNNNDDDNNNNKSNNNKTNCFVMPD